MTNPTESNQTKRNKSMLWSVICEPGSAGILVSAKHFVFDMEELTQSNPIEPNYRDIPYTISCLPASTTIEQPHFSIEGQR